MSLTCAAPDVPAGTNAVCVHVCVSKSQTILISCKDLTARVVVMTSTTAAAEVAALQTALKEYNNNIPSLI